MINVSEDTTTIPNCLFDRIRHDTLNGDCTVGFNFMQELAHICNRLISLSSIAFLTRTNKQ
jgi:hypothetical protein